MMRARSMRWTHLGSLFIASLLVAACGASGSTPPAAASDRFAVASTAKVDNQGRGLDVGDLAPDFMMTQSNGKTSRLSDWKGRPVVINFWATWCTPCQEEMPLLIEAHRTHSADGLIMLGVNAQESAEQAKKFVDKFQIPFAVVLDSRGEVMQLYTVRGLPTTVFIDREGRIVARYAGLLSRKVLDEFLVQIQ